MAAAAALHLRRRLCGPSRMILKAVGTVFHNGERMRTFHLPLPEIAEPAYLLAFSCIYPSLLTECSISSLGNERFIFSMRRIIC
jgi:hypothetical protein